MEHPAFIEAGQAAGVEIWTIDNFEPVPIDNKKYGKFYNADSYIVLKTKESSSSALSYDAHFWLGAQTTHDKKGAAAILTVTLDDMLGGRAVHHREVQGHESSLFLGYFKPAIRYLEGGLESGFTEVETNAGAEKRLLKLSGCDNMRIEQVAAESSSLSKDHCFILEVDHDIFVLMPEGAKATQRRRIISIANTLRDEDHNGRATIEIIDEFSCDEDIERFFEALGSGSKDDLADALSSESFEREDTTVYLYKALLGEELELVALSKPYKQKHLASEEVYILDTPDAGIFVWIGGDVSTDVSNNYHDLVQQYIDVKGYPAWLPATRVTEGSESSLFKQYFANWEVASNIDFHSSLIDAGYDTGDDEEVKAKRVGKSAAASGYMPDEGNGVLSVTRFASGEADDISEKFAAGVALLYQSETYVVKYQTEDDQYVIYYWKGSDASKEDKAAATELVSQLEEEFEDSVTTVVKVPQGKEPKHFLSIFKGNLAVLFGSKDNEYAPDNANHDYEDTGVRLFRVEGTSLGVDMRAVQVPETADTLEDDDVFVLETPSTVYVRLGTESSEAEEAAAMEFVKLATKESHSVVTVQQDLEPDEFWDALGGKQEDKEDNSGWRNIINRRVNAERTLTAVTVKLSGKIVFEEVPSYSQEDLSDDGVYILDTGEELFYWKGKNVPERVRNAKSDIIESYISDDGLDRTAESAIVVSVKQGSEPAVFKKLFKQWDGDMWNNQTSYDDIKNEVKAGN